MLLVAFGGVFVGVVGYFGLAFEVVVVLEAGEGEGVSDVCHGLRGEMGVRSENKCADRGNILRSPTNFNKDK